MRTYLVQLSYLKNPKCSSTNPIQRRYGYSSNENYCDEDYYEEEKSLTECFECGSKFPYDEDCPECEVPQSLEEEGYSPVKEETPRKREYMSQKSPIYDTEETIKLERKIEKVDNELKRMLNNLIK